MDKKMKKIRSGGKGTSNIIHEEETLEYSWETLKILT